MKIKAQGIFIKGNFPSFKNSKRMIIKKGQKPRLIHSKTVMKYKKISKIEWLLKKKDFLSLVREEEKPFKIGIHFIRGTKHKQDWVNLVQGVQDLMVEYEYIKDDNSDEIIPVPFKLKGKYYTYNKDNPGIWIVPITKKLIKNLKK